jgi:hypothetical protein
MLYSLLLGRETKLSLGPSYVIASEPECLGC